MKTLEMQNMPIYCVIYVPFIFQIGAEQNEITHERISVIKTTANQQEELKILLLYQNLHSHKSDFKTKMYVQFLNLHRAIVSVHVIANLNKLS